MPRTPAEPADVELDRTDLRILAELQRDGRLTNQALAERVALSPSPCLRRVRRLEEAGVIRGYVALVEPRAVGLGVVAYSSVRLEKRAPVRGGRIPYDEFREAVRDWPEVVACHATTGDVDYLLRVHVGTLDDFSRFVQQRLLRHPGVIDVRTSFALDVIKDTTALPLR
ncbi:MAG TPA: Lrp/AsnC family transcriptional regulator [Burkholderiaceae bacterium]|nr:Lrp/AsnC family transcriptional regulator [Burkholderiaceae bacterium]